MFFILAILDVNMLKFSNYYILNVIIYDVNLFLIKLHYFCICKYF